MVHDARGEKQPLSTLTHYGLVKLLILDAVEDTQLSWNQFMGHPREENQDEYEL